MPSDFLFRALRTEEIQAGILIPKSQAPFEALPMLGIDTHLPFSLAVQTEYAVRQHQWKQRGYPTRGVSTTPHEHRARYYASRDRTIAVIRRSCLRDFGIQEFVVNDVLGDHPGDIACREDNEVILVSPNDGPFSSTVIERVYTLESG
jgi:hypothetical protein